MAQADEALHVFFIQEPGLRDYALTRFRKAMSNDKSKQFTRRGLFGALLAAALLPLESEARGRRGGGGRRSSGRSSRRSTSSGAGYGASGGYSNGDCACGTGNICTGPRGGRYCMTASGNKNYQRR